MCAMRPLSPPPSLSPPASVRAGRCSVRSDRKSRIFLTASILPPEVQSRLELLAFYVKYGDFSHLGSSDKPLGGGLQKAGWKR